MSYENPTALRVGMTGTLVGWRTRVAGRVVLGMDDGGETYYWQEFNLVDASGVDATLVFEETENGPTWKLFKAFTPLRAMTAADARAKRVGQMTELHGLPTRISVVDQSRVYHIEGIAPEGVNVGDVANYFNAEAGNRMLVVSWTGDEIEFYDGQDLSPQDVASAFGLPPLSTAGFQAGNDSFTRASTRPKVTIVGVALTLFALFGAFSCLVGNRRSRAAAEPPPRRTAPVLQLANGAHGMLGAHNVSVANRAVLAIGTVGARYDCREYDLKEDDGQHQLLVQGLTGAEKEWHLLTPIDEPADFSPYVAAAQRKGATVRLTDRAAQIAELFQANTLSAEGGEARPLWPPGPRYGFVARATDEWIVARWDEAGIRFYRGRALAEAAVVSALGTQARPAR